MGDIETRMLRLALIEMDDAVMALGRVMLREEAKPEPDMAAIGKAIAEALNTHLVAKRALGQDQDEEISRTDG